MAKMMRAAVVRKFTEPLSVEEVPLPEVGGGQIEACGVCHTDQRMATGRSNPSRLSFLVAKASEMGNYGVRFIGPP